MWAIHPVEYYSATKRQEGLTHRKEISRCQGCEGNEEMGPQELEGRVVVSLRGLGFLFGIMNCPRVKGGDGCTTLRIE